MTTVHLSFVNTRIDYKLLGMLRAQFPRVPILGLTATAGEHVLADCLQILRIPDALVFRASFNRPNLFYEVLARCSSYAHFHTAASRWEVIT